MEQSKQYIEGLVSVIVPNYNREDFIETTIRSVIKQTYTNWELLFIDDCSTDNSLAIAQKLQNEDSRIRIIRTEKNYGGPAGPRNIGLDNARGEYVLFLDSDDILHYSLIEIEMDTARRYKTDFVSADVRNFMWEALVELNFDYEVKSKDIRVEKYTFSRLIKKNNFHTSTVLIKKSAIGNIRFREERKYHAIEDFEFWLKVHEKISYSIKIRNILAFYRLHRGSISKEKIQMFKKNIMLYKEYRHNDKNLGYLIYFYLFTYIIISIKKAVKSYLYFNRSKERFYAMLDEHAPNAQTHEHIEHTNEMPEAHSQSFVRNLVSKRNTPILFQFIGDFLSIFCSASIFMLVGHLTGLHNFPRDINGNDIIILSCVNVGAWITLFWFTGLYSNWYVRSPFDEFFTLIRTTFFGCLVLYLIILIDSVAAQGEIRFKLFIFWLILLILVASTRLAVRIVQRILRRSKLITIPALVLGDSDSLAELISAISENPAWGYEINGAILSTATEYEEWKHSSETDEIPALGTIDDMNSIINSHNVESLIIAWENPPHPVLLEIAALCAGHRINVKIKPDLYDIFTGRVKTLPIFSSQLIEIQAQILTPWQSFLKRSIDVIFASLFLLLGSPLWLAIAILVKFDSPGPIFYTQNRVGKNGRVFRIYKFRSMSHGASQQQYGIWTSKNDPRVTKFGKFIRKTHLDEVPQMWNVIKGDMSVVGPRPEQPSIVEKYVKVLPIYARRHMVRPGITGWWQIKSRAYEESLTEMQRRLRYDFYYIENLSVKLDIEIILRTVYTVISGHGQA